MNEELLKELFDGLDLKKSGTFDEFKNDMNDPETRKGLFDHYKLSKNGSFEDFESDLGYSNNKAQKFFGDQLNQLQEDSSNRIAQTPRVGVSSKKALGQEDPFEPKEIARETTTANIQLNTAPILQPRILSPDDDPIAVGAQEMPNITERLNEGLKENPERATFEVYSDAIRNSEGIINNNIEYSKLIASQLMNKKYSDAGLDPNDALHDYLEDTKRLTKVLDQGIMSDDQRKKYVDSYRNKWEPVIADEKIQKYLWSSIEFADKIDKSKNEIRDNTPNYQKYLDDIKTKQIIEDNIDYSNPSNWGKALLNKVSRVAIGTNGEDLMAGLETYFGVGHKGREFFRQMKERNPSATRFQRNMIEDYITENGVDYVVDDKGNFQYAVDPESGNKVDVLNIPDDKIKQAFENKETSTRRVPGAIASQSADEFYQELPGIGLSIISSGVGSAIVRGIKASKYAGQASRALNAIESTTRLSRPTIKKLAEGSVEFAAGSLEGTADARDEAYKMGLEGSQVTGWVLANNIANGAEDVFNPMETAWMNTKSRKFFKNLSEKYGSGNISKLDLLKESGAQFALDFSKNITKETIGEWLLSPVIRNTLHEASDVVTGSNTSENRDEISLRSLETSFYGSIISTGAFSIPTSIRISKDNLMKDAIDYAIKNPEAYEGYYNGLQTIKGNGLERAEFFKNTIDQVKESNLNEKDKSTAAALIFDRQSTSLEIDRLTKTYGADAPIIRNLQKQQLEIDKELDNLYSKGRTNTEPVAQAAETAVGIATENNGALNGESSAPNLEAEDSKSTKNKFYSNTKPSESLSNEVGVDNESSKLETQNSKNFELERERILQIEDPELRKSEEIKFIMSNLLPNVGKAEAQKVQEYVERIRSGKESREKVIEGLPKSFVDSIDKMLLPLSGEPNESIVENNFVPKSIKELGLENKTTYPKIPSNKVFLNEVDVLPYEKLKLSSKYMEGSESDKLPSEEIEIKDIVPTQKNLRIENLEKTKNIKDNADENIVVYKDGEKYYILDGHHRIANSILEGNNKIKVKVFDINNESDQSSGRVEESGGGNRPANKGYENSQKQGRVDKENKGTSSKKRDAGKTDGSPVLENQESQLADEEAAADRVSPVRQPGLSESKSVKRSRNVKKSNIWSGNVDPYSDNINLIDQTINEEREERNRNAKNYLVDNAYDLVAQFFVGGLKIHSDVIKTLFGKSGGEIKSRIGLIDNNKGIGKKTKDNSNPIDTVAHYIWESRPEHLQELDTSEIANAVEDVIRENNGTIGMAQNLNDKYGETNMQEFDEVSLEEKDEIVSNNKEITADRKPTQEEIDSGVFDEEGNFLLFSKSEEGLSDEEEMHKRKCK